MSGKQDKDQPNEDHNIFEQDEEAQRDPTDEIIGEAFDRMLEDDDSNDDGGFDAPLETRQSDMPDVVNTEDGKQLLDEAEDRNSKRKPQPDFEGEGEKDDGESEGDDASNQAETDDKSEDEAKEG